MLKKYLNKAFGASSAAEANTKKEDVQMTNQVNDANAELLTQATTALAEANTKLADALAQVEQMKQMLKDSQDAQLAAQEQAKKVKMDARKQKIADAVGTAKADALLAATEGLEDAAFEAVVNAMAVNLDAEAKTEAFQEVGKVAKSDTEEIEKIETEKKESEEAKLLKAKYQPK